jgi:glutathione S-transferase
MRTLYHMFLSPFSRKVRIALREKGLDFEMKFEKVWERRTGFLALNPAGKVPVLVEDDGAVIADSVAITEYLEEAYPDTARLLPDQPRDRAEVRRLVAWFDGKFGFEVTTNLVGEKLMKRFLGRAEPNSSAIRAGKENLRTHMNYIGYLSERRNWLAGERFSLADIAAAAQVSCIDYLGDVPWDECQAAKDWYARVKSRPSFRPLLADHIPGAPPPAHYADLDF